MRRAFISSALCALLLTLASEASAQISFGLSFGTPPPPPRVYVVPAQPAPDFVWVEGYWYPQGNHYRWHDGYWTEPPFAEAYLVAPYYVGGRYYSGYWEGARGRRFEHDHRWDRDHDRRDYRRWDRDERREERREDRREDRQR